MPCQEVREGQLWVLSTKVYCRILYCTAVQCATLCCAVLWVLCNVQVFYGEVVLDDGTEREVAVKRTKADRKKNMKKFDSGFKNEILVLSGVRHRNLVELIGYSSKGADVLLVYEFVPQGSVDDLLKKGASASHTAPPRSVLVSCRRVAMVSFSSLSQGSMDILSKEKKNGENAPCNAQ